MSAIIIEAALRLGVLQEIYKPIPSLTVYSTYPYDWDDKLGVHYGNNIQYSAGLAKGRHIAFLKNYQTNDMGFSDPDNYRAKLEGPGHKTAFFGDSMLASFGGDQWFSSFRKVLSGVNPSHHYFNFGVDGTGIIDITQKIRALHQEFLFDQVNILAIGNDFVRKTFIPVDQDDHLSFCLPDRVASVSGCPVDGNKKIILNLNHDTLRKASVSVAEKLVERATLYPKFEIMVFYDWLSKRPNSKMGPKCLPVYGDISSNGSQYEVFNKSIRLLRDTLQDLKVSSKIFYLPIKPEINSDLDCHEPIHARLKDIKNLTFVDLSDFCDFKTNDFYLWDVHLNDKGYQKLSDCLQVLVD